MWYIFKAPKHIIPLQGIYGSFYGFFKRNLTTRLDFITGGSRIPVKWFPLVLCMRIYYFEIIERTCILAFIEWWCFLLLWKNMPQIRENLYENHTWTINLSYSPETLNLGQNRWFFKIWWMTLKRNRASFLCYFKLCASFHSHQWIQTWITVWKRPIWVKIDDHFSCVT